MISSAGGANFVIWLHEPIKHLPHIPGTPYPPNFWWVTKSCPQGSGMCNMIIHTVGGVSTFL